MSNTAKVHVIYIIAILVTIIIILMAVNWNNVQSLPAYLSFSAGVASLLLSIIAIIYAFYANTSFTQTVGKLESAASTITGETKNLETNVKELKSELKETPKAIENLKEKILQTDQVFKDTTEKLENYVRSIKEGTEGLNKSIETVKSQLAEIPPVLHGLEGKVSNVHDMVEQEKAGKLARNEQKEKNANEQPSVRLDEYCKTFLDSCSWNGLKVIYLCNLAHLQKKKFKPAKWVEQDKLMDLGYFLGYLVATASAGMVYASKLEEELEIEDVNNTIAENIQIYLKTKAKQSAEWEKQIPLLEKFIAECPSVVADLETN